MTISGKWPVFEGYNLRGLVVTYLESRGWKWDAAAEAWTRGSVTFSGDDATDRAIHEQIEREEGRRP